MVRYLEHHVFIGLIWAVNVLMILVAAVFVFPPRNFPAGTIVHVEKGKPLSAIALELEKQDVIKSSSAFELLARMQGVDNSAKAGDYYFDTAENATEVMSRLTRGDFKLIPLAVRIREGMSSREIALYLGTRLNNFDTAEFLKKAKGLEGYLYPDTYYFLPNISPQEVVTSMYNNFLTKTADLKKRAAEKNKSLSEIVILASLIEKEASNPKDQHLISGVLQNRIALGIPLQVDAVFPYIMGKNTFELTYDDLTVDSPYNTYKYKGLPPGPIGNPSIAAMEAALDPTDSHYLFYLADRRGVTHYARTYSAHKQNKNIYLP